jgi:hypothetical protein
MTTLIRSIVLSSVLFSSAAQMRDVDGTARDLFAPAGTASVLVFVRATVRFPTATGRNSSASATTIARRVWRVRWYEDMSIDAAHVRAHRESHGYKDVAAVIDTDGVVAKRAKATVTPQAVVIGPGGIVKHRGRIDNQTPRSASRAAW